MNEARILPIVPRGFVLFEIELLIETTFAVQKLP